MRLIMKFVRDDNGVTTIIARKRGVIDVGWLHHQFSESLGINPLIIVISKHAKRKF
jgi:hypothetical protein